MPFKRYRDSSSAGKNDTRKEFGSREVTKKAALEIADVWYILRNWGFPSFNVYLFHSVQVDQ